MKTPNAEFIAGAESPEFFPESELPEVAFAGRSNVGKSSLLNSLVLRKNLARISSRPGKTKQINFYLVDGKRIFADLPGYGYASVSKERRNRWTELIETYLKTRENLKLVCALIDAKPEPMRNDLAFLENLENWGLNYLIILTKSDKLNKKEIEARKRTYEYLTSQCRGIAEVLPYSSKKRTGREEAWAIIKRYCEK